MLKSKVINFFCNKTFLITIYSVQKANSKLQITSVFYVLFRFQFLPFYFKNFSKKYFGIFSCVMLTFSAYPPSSFIFGSILV